MDERGESSKASCAPATPVKPHQDPICEYEQEYQMFQPSNFVHGQICQGNELCQETTGASVLSEPGLPKSASCDSLTSSPGEINIFSGPSETPVQGFSLHCVDKNMPFCDLLALVNARAARTINSASNSFVGSIPATQIEDKELKQRHEKTCQPEEDKHVNNTNGVVQQSEPSIDAASKQVPENGNSGQGSDAGLGRATPAQKKPRRKRYMPKVVREGQAKRTPNVKTQKPVKPNDASTLKRKHIQKKETSIPPNINFVDLTETDEEAPSESPNKDAPLKSPTKITRNIHPDTPSINSFSSKPKTASRPRKLCKRSLNFDVSSQVEEIKSSCEHAVKFDLKSRAEGSYTEIQTTVQLSHGPEAATAGKSQVEHISDVQSGSTRGKKETSRKRSRGSSTRVKIIASLVETSEHMQSTRSSTMQEDGNAHQPYIHAAKTTKKQTKRNTRNTGSSPGAMLSVDALVDHLRLLDINAERKQGTNPNTSAGSCNSARCQEQNTLVVYQRDGTLVTVKEQTTRPRVELDEETIRVWNLLLEDINSEGIDGRDETTKKWWEDERRTFNARANSFIKCMHLIQGDRTFSRWKGSVVDSVVGVFLTQNVSDHLSSSAYMSLAARFPLVLESNHDPLPEEVMNIPVDDPETDALNPDDTLKEMKSKHPTLNQRSVMIQEIECENIEVLNSNEPCASSIDCGEVAMSSGIHSEGTEILWGEETGSSRGTARCSVDRVCQPQTSSPNLKNEVESIDKEKIYQVERVGFERNTGTLDVIGSTGVFDVSESSSCLSENIKNARASCHVQRHRDSHSNPNGKTYKPNKGRRGKGKQPAAEWDSFRKQAQAKANGVRVRTPNTMDSVDWEAVRLADINEVAHIIRDRGMNNVLAERIKEFLDRLVSDHGSIDLEWLRDVPPDKAKEYLMSIRGLGLKSVECVRLLTLHHVAFPVDTNVGRIAVRLGWVPLQPLPESLQLHLLEMYPVLSSIQKYLWPRLCKLDQRTLYELHYQMITFGKVFCTKNKPNCNACPLRGECRHFASAFASARLALPGPEKRDMETTEYNADNENFVENIDRLQLPVSLSDQLLEANTQISHCAPIIEVPASPGPIIELPQTPEAEREQVFEDDIEDFFSEDPEDIPTIKLNIEEFTQTLQEYIQQNMGLQESDVSKSLVALTPEAASIPAVKLKTMGRLRTEHQVYELPDTHPLLKGLEQRESDDPCSYLLAIWTPGETADSIQPPTGPCSNQESGSFCDDNTCFACSSTREAQSQTVRGTLLIPCRTAMRGSFPLNGTYFQVNEVFADHASSLCPLEVPRYLLWNLPRKTVYFGTSITAIFRGMTMKDIQLCFWKGYVCVRGFDRESRAPKPLIARLHFPPSKLSKGNEKKEKE